jgi:hypothetical protein
MGGRKVISTSASASCSLRVLVLLLWSAVGTVQCRHCPPTPAGLREDFYVKSCPQLFDIVEAGVKNAIRTDVRITASLLRVSFHDCWIGVLFSQLSPSPPHHYRALHLRIHAQVSMLLQGPELVRETRDLCEDLSSTL